MPDGYFHYAQTFKAEDVWYNMFSRCGVLKSLSLFPFSGKIPNGTDVMKSSMGHGDIEG